MEHPITESVWKRAKHDTKQVRYSGWFFVLWEGTGAVVLGAVGGWFGYLLTPQDAAQDREFIYPLVGGVVGVVVGLVIVFALIFVWKLTRASFKQRDEARCALAASQTQQESPPSLTIEDVFYEGSEGSGDCWVLRIRNSGVNEAENCVGRLVDLEFAQPQEGQSLFRWPRNSSLEWTDGPREVVNIPARQTATLRLATFNFSQGFPTSRLRIAYANNRESSYLPSEREILLVVSVSSRGTLPQFAVCLVDMISAPIMMSVKVWLVSEEQPTIDDCRQLVLDREEDLSAE